MSDMIPVKHNVTVQARFTIEGSVIPELIKWPDGREFEIDRILDIRNAPSEAGGCGRRYKVRIMGHERYLFYANNYEQNGGLGWFVESKKQYQRSGGCE